MSSWKIVERRQRPRKQITVSTSESNYGSGVDITVSRSGISVSAFYDSIVGISGFSVTWEELADLRQQVDKVGGGR